MVNPVHLYHPLILSNATISSTPALKGTLLLGKCWFMKEAKCGTDEWPVLDKEWGFFAYNFARKHARDFTDTDINFATVRIYLGLSKPKKTGEIPFPGDRGFDYPETGGDMPDTQLFWQDGRAQSRTTPQRDRWPGPEKDGGADKLPAGEHADYGAMAFEWKGAKPKTPLDHPRQPVVPYRTTDKRRPEYVRLYHGGQDPVCISAVGVQYHIKEVVGDVDMKNGMTPNEYEHAVFGDIMKECGWDYYEQPKPIDLGDRKTINNDFTNSHTPYCFWMGGPAHPQHVWINMPEFDGEKRAEHFNQNRDEMCVPWRLNRLSNNVAKEDTAPLVFSRLLKESDRWDKDKVLDRNNWRWRIGDEYQPVYDAQNPKASGPAKTKRERDDRPAIEASKFDHWISEYSVSSSPEERYSAIQKCKDREHGFTGPDWANSYERLYCHLPSGMVLPYCENDEQSNCFDASEEALRHEQIEGEQPQLGLIAKIKEWWSGSTTQHALTKKTVRHDF